MRNGFRKLKQELERLEYFCTGTVLKRMMKCSKATFACRSACHEVASAITPNWRNLNAETDRKQGIFSYPAL